VLIYTYVNLTKWSGVLIQTTRHVHNSNFAFKLCLFCELMSDKQINMQIHFHVVKSEFQYSLTTTGIVLQLVCLSLLSDVVRLLDTSSCLTQRGDKNRQFVSSLHKLPSTLEDHLSFTASRPVIRVLVLNGRATMADPFRSPVSSGTGYWKFVKFLVKTRANTGAQQSTPLG
jgi:hypothetical protein